MSIALSVSEAVARAQALATAPGRSLLGIAGAPGSGKSTIAALLAAAVTGSVVVPMDGFHLPTSALLAIGGDAVERRGAPHTFDTSGYVELLTRLRAGEAVLAPDFDRSIEEPVADVITVPVDVPLVITEGNYLLLDAAPWASVPSLLDEIWFVDVSEPARVDRLVARFVSFGWDPAVALDRVLHGSDASNAALVTGTRSRASSIVTPD